MSAGRLFAIASKELIQIRRDPRSLLITLLMPIMQMVMLGYGISLDIRHIAVYAYDQEGSQQSQALLKRFQASPYFDVVTTVNNYGELTRAIDADRCKLGLVIPFDFTKSIRETGKGSVQAIVDGADDNTANLAINYARAVIAGYSGQLQLAWMERNGIASAGGAPPISIEARTWFNEDLESRNFIIPGIIALVLAMVGALLTSLTIAREWERGTMEQLISTPVTSREVMLGKILPYFGIGMADAALCCVMAVWWFGVPFRGTMVALLASTALFLVVVLGIGFMISVAIRSQLGASMIALLVTLLPTSMLSGYAFPIDQMPAPIQALSYVVYSRYYVTLLKDIFLKGADIREVAAPMAAMSIFALGIGLLALRAFHKTLD